MALEIRWHKAEPHQDVLEKVDWMTEELRCLEVGRAASRRITFSDLVEPVLTAVRNLSWLVSRDIIFGRSPEGDMMSEEEIDNVIVRRFDDWLVMSPDLVSRYAKFVDNDWCDVIGVVNPSILSDLPNLNRSFLEEEVAISFACVDGAYWLALSRHEELLQAMQSKFPSSRHTSLEAAKQFLYFL